jgi:hypothetical protein
MSFGYDRLKQTGEKGARKKTNNQWFETQDTIGYWEDFSKQKVVWARLMRISKTDTNNFPRFTLLPEKTYIADSLCFFIGEDIEFLQGILNSEFAEYYFFNNIAILDDGGMQMRQQYVELIPIPFISTLFKEEIVNAVKLLNTNYSKDVDIQINNIVYKAYNLDDEEIQHIKQHIKNKMSDITGTL